MIVWLNGAHGVGKSTNSVLVQQAIPDSRILDAEKVGEVLMDVKPALPATDNFQHWPPWRPFVVETALRLIEYTGGTLIMPMTVLVEDYWREISSGFDEYGIPIRHFVLHADALCWSGSRTTRPSDRRCSGAHTSSHTPRLHGPGFMMRPR
jgi:hypothetical protein